MGRQQSAYSDQIIELNLPAAYFNILIVVLIGPPHQDEGSDAVSR
jgi:hypothetical protein